MTYYRLRDITTPPFAYVANREDAVHSCSLCMMPYFHLNAVLDVEIFTTRISGWKRAILGQPLMAEYWLIGDALFGETFRSIVGEDVGIEEVHVVSWLTRNKAVQDAHSDEWGSPMQAGDLPVFFRYFATRSIALDSDQSRQYPPIECSACQRSIPDIPMDVLPLPQADVPEIPFGYLNDLHLEGYDYLFREDVAQRLKETFPTMILEPIRGEPTLF